MKVSTKGQPAAHAEEIRQYLSFVLGKDAFAVNILCIKEILQFASPTEVPLMPPWLRGVINLRGAVVPVIDLAYRLGRGLSQEGRRSCVVILEVRFGGQVVDIGVMVDAVSAVIDIDARQIEAAPALGGSLQTDFMEGIGKLESGFVIILNISKIFSSGELSALANMQLQEA
ncbi:chemotaxis protein CheW [Massilia sp. W12]|uniref:chemotaxis protein CheW n=1 Tax=Massilia sp. W12 TaxID=3126507 RepID=UPI0030CCE0BB